MAVFVQIGFGIVALSMAFLVLVFTRAYRDPSKRLDRRYRLVAAALAVGNAGTLVWALNPLSQSFGGPPLNPYLMMLASVLIQLSVAALIGSTAMGGNPKTLRWFLLLSFLWAVACSVYSFV
jgi:hypothetical protein